jgi:glycosyltransferase involved in cell wall biosynthesis
MAIIEAMARGLPVVGGPTVAWMIEDAGIAVEDYRPASFAAALERLLADDELRNRLAKAGPERASRFDWTIATAAYVREIEACL